MGYQIVVGGLSVFIVLLLHAPVWVFAVIEAVSYGVGALFAYIGGFLADRYGIRISFVTAPLNRNVMTNREIIVPIELSMLITEGKSPGTHSTLFSQPGVRRSGGFSEKRTLF